MKNKALKNHSIRKCRGIVLLVTLVLLVVLSILGYTLSARVSATCHRNQYMIDYCQARYGCDSAIKYALASLDINTPPLIARPNEPDFSDLFALSQEEYEQLLEEWWDQSDSNRTVGYKSETENLKAKDFPDDFDNFNDVNWIDDINGFSNPDAADSLTIRGPYGPPWPFTTEPLEFEIGSAKVTIEIEDENAKYPIGWPLLDDEDVKREAEAGFETFCEWMDLDEAEIKSLKDQLKQISEIKPFKLKFEPINIVKKTSTRTRRRSRRPRSQQVSKIPSEVHITDFANLFHSSLIDTDLLARPTTISEDRKESALKYMGTWASSRVNVNTAPRQVLEAAFTFGGDAVEIAEEIIQRRRIKPFENIDDLKNSLLRYSDSIGKCQNYITTVSTFFTIRVTAVSGVAKASTIIAVMRDGQAMKQIAAISGRI